MNSITKKDSYPIPRIDEMLEAVSGSKWFSVVDLKSGFWQVELDSRDKEKTAFMLGNELWQFKVLPFGLCNAPSTFTRVMNTVLKGLTWKICLVYIDDIIIFSKTFEEHLENSELVLKRLRKAHLKVNAKKCLLNRQEVMYLGYIISGSGIKTSQEKTSSIIDWSLPANKTEVKSFLGLSSYYRKFVRNFASIAKPLHQLTEEKRQFIWNKEAQTDFTNLKKALTTPPILAFPSVDEPFILDTDASNSGIGAVLSQIQLKEEKVIAYFSKVFNKSEKNYCVTRRELLAVIRSVEHFRHYLMGRKFKIRTDHASLQWLVSFKNPEGQVARWLEILFQYDFEIVHRSGRIHSNADRLSRRPCSEDLCKPCAKLDAKNSEIERLVCRTTCRTNEDINWVNLQRKDATINTIIDFKKRIFVLNGLKFLIWIIRSKFIFYIGIHLFSITSSFINFGNRLIWSKRFGS